MTFNSTARCANVIRISENNEQKNDFFTCTAVKSKQMALTQIYFVINSSGNLSACSVGIGGEGESIAHWRSVAAVAQLLLLLLLLLMLVVAVASGVCLSWW